MPVPAQFVRAHANDISPNNHSRKTSLEAQKAQHNHIAFIKYIVQFCGRPLISCFGSYALLRKSDFPNHPQRSLHAHDYALPLGRGSSGVHRALDDFTYWRCRADNKGHSCGEHIGQVSRPSFSRPRDQARGVAACGLSPRNAAAGCRISPGVRRSHPHTRGVPSSERQDARARLYLHPS